MKTLVICLILLVAVSAVPRPDHHESGHKSGALGSGGQGVYHGGASGQGHHGGSSGHHQGGLIGGGSHDYGTHGTQGSHGQHH